MSHDTTARTGAPARDAAGVYALGADTDETARLQRQSEELQPEARALLARLGELGLRPGQTALDLGCGPRGILDLLAEAVGPGGRVVGLDADPAHVTAARQFAFSQGLANVEVLAGDARHTGLPAESFDLVHTRTLLVTIPEPAEVVAEMARLARPGGLVASQEADAEFSICYPPLPEWDRLLALFRASFPRAGADLRLGRRLPELFRGGGADRRRGDGVRRQLPGGAFAAHRDPRPGAQPAPGDPRPRAGRRA